MFSNILKKKTICLRAINCIIQFVPKSFSDSEAEIVTKVLLSGQGPASKPHYPKKWEGNF